MAMPSFSDRGAAGADPELRLREWLSRDRLRASIRKVACGHRVPKDQLDDVVHDTIERAMRARLPDDEGEAVKYVHGIAANVARGRMGKAARAESRSYVEGADDEGAEVSTVGVPPADFESRDILNRLVAKGQRRFPTGFPSFLEAKATHATAEQIAARRGVSAGHVRREWGDIARYMRRHAKVLGLVVAGMLFFVLGDMTRWGQEAPRVAAAPPESVLLRSRARAECARERWAECLRDLDRARDEDPRGETPELRRMRDRAVRKAASTLPAASSAAPSLPTDASGR